MPKKKTEFDPILDRLSATTNVFAGLSYSQMDRLTADGVLDLAAWLRLADAHMYAHTRVPFDTIRSVALAMRSNVALADSNMRPLCWPPGDGLPSIIFIPNRNLTMNQRIEALTIIWAKARSGPEETRRIEWSEFVRSQGL